MVGKLSLTLAEVCLRLSEGQYRVRDQLANGYTPRNPNIQ
jgi:hypothetical protein